MGKMSQKKGRTAERELAAILQQHGYDVRPGAALSYGQEPDIVGLKNVHIEVKRRENVNLSAALEQAQQDSERFGGLPTVFHRKSRENWRVTMPLSAWLTLYQQAMTCKCDGQCQGSGGHDDYLGDRKQSGGDSGASVADDLFDAKGRETRYDPQ